MAVFQGDFYHRLESRRGDRDLNNGFAARVHDPLWFLARQWQMGEHQGENASTPVRIECAVTQTPIAPIGGNAAFDPKIVPAEALVESELEDWWTMGRRIRVGARFAANAAVASRSTVQFRNPPPPYEVFAGKVDGRAVWLARQQLGLTDASFGTDRPPPDSPDAWDPARFCYNATFKSPAGELQVSNHRGGSLDWYSADSKANSGVGANPPDVKSVLVPTPLEYRGAPHSRFWEIEDSKVDIGGYAPDTAHFPTMLLVELIYSHSDDWFLFPVEVESGSVVTIKQLKVIDSFGEPYDSTEKLASGAARYPGLSAPTDFSIYSCVGLAPESLVVWPVAEGPLQSEPIERVQFGVDEQSNVLWALERIIDSRQAARGPQTPDAAHPVYLVAPPSGDLTKEKTYAYKPAQGLETYWHPYQLNWNASPGGPAYEQWGLADYSLQKPKLMPRPAAKVLFAGTPAAPKLHTISAAVMTGGGLELERRWRLARDIKGRPVLWVERQRNILRAAPARNLRFDVLEESS